MEGRLLRLLRCLQEGGVEFILVGGLSGVLNGAPIHTEDVDIVPRREASNLERLLSVLSGLDAHYRADPTRRLRPTAAHLASAGHQNLTTQLGWLDVLGTVGNDLAYPDLVPHSHRLEIAFDLAIQVLDLETYVKIKEALGTEKDRAQLPVLRRTLAERNKAK
ncbi:MAG: hypothetical protein ACRD2D_14130 [Terriglobales bacterium]